MSIRVKGKFNVIMWGVPVNKKLLLSAFLIVMMFVGLALADTVRFGNAQSSTSFSGIISSDTTWTKANSPYNFTGPVAVNSGVTLTIGPGVTVNLGKFYLQVNGTLNAQGSATDKVIFISGDRHVYPADNIYLLKSNAECTIANAILTNTSIQGAIDTSVEINNCVFEGVAGFNVWGSSKISNNYIMGEAFARGSSVISNNTILNGIDVSGSYTISGNNITNHEGIWVMDVGGTGTVSDNIISGGTTAGINLAGPSTIERNLIINNQLGISIRSNVNFTIRNNTIANNYIGIRDPSPSQTIIYNNIQNNTYNVNLGSHLDVNAPYNWWGTADPQAINQTIYDSKNDLNLGKVNFIPFLTEPNPAAMPSESPEIPEFPSWIILPLFIIATMMLIAYGKKRKR